MMKRFAVSVFKSIPFTKSALKMSTSIRFNSIMSNRSSYFFATQPPKNNPEDL